MDLEIKCAFQQIHYKERFLGKKEPEYVFCRLMANYMKSNHQCKCQIEICPVYNIFLKLEENTN